MLVSLDNRFDYSPQLKRKRPLKIEHFHWKCPLIVEAFGLDSFDVVDTDIGPAKFD